MVLSRWAMGAGALLLACGARVAENGASGTADGTGGRAVAGRGSGGTAGLDMSAAAATGRAGGAPVVAGDGSGGLPLGEGGFTTDIPAPDGGTACSYEHRACNTFDSFVEILEDGKLVRLSYPGDVGCGRCVPGGCDLYGNVHDACSVYIYVSVCAGPDGMPPCIDTASGSPSYIDRTGKRWTGATLLATSLPTTVGDPSTNILDVQASLAFADGAQQPVLPAHVHFCASVSRSLHPC